MRTRKPAAGTVSSKVSHQKPNEYDSHISTQSAANGPKEMASSIALRHGLVGARLARPGQVGRALFLVQADILCVLWLR